MFSASSHVKHTLSIILIPDLEDGTDLPAPDSFWEKYFFGRNICFQARGNRLQILDGRQGDETELGARQLSTVFSETSPKMQRIYPGSIWLKASSSWRDW